MKNYLYILLLTSGLFNNLVHASDVELKDDVELKEKNEKVIWVKIGFQDIDLGDPKSVKKFFDDKCKILKYGDNYFYTKSIVIDRLKDLLKFLIDNEYDTEEYQQIIEDIEKATQSHDFMDME